MLFFGKLPRGKGRGEVYLNGRGCDRLFEQCFCDQKVWMTYVHTPCLPCIHNSSVLSTERRDETECRWQSNDEISNILLKRRQTRFKRTELASQVGSFVSRISPEIEQPPLRRGADRVQGISVSFPLHFVAVRENTSLRISVSLNRDGTRKFHRTIDFYLP